MCAFRTSLFNYKRAAFSQDLAKCKKHELWTEHAQCIISAKYKLCEHAQLTVYAFVLCSHQGRDVCMEPPVSTVDDVFTADTQHGVRALWAHVMYS